MTQPLKGHKNEIKSYKNVCTDSGGRWWSSIEGKLTREKMKLWLGTQGNCEQDLPFFFFWEHLLTKIKGTNRWFMPKEVTC